MRVKCLVAEVRQQRAKVRDQGCNVKSVPRISNDSRAKPRRKELSVSREKTESDEGQR